MRERVGREDRVIEDDRFGFAAEELEAQSVGGRSQGHTNVGDSRIRHKLQWHHIETLYGVTFGVHGPYQSADVNPAGQHRPVVLF